MDKFKLNKKLKILAFLFVLANVSLFINSLFSQEPPQTLQPPFHCKQVAKLPQTTTKIGFYTTDGKYIYYFPYWFPRSVHRHYINLTQGPNFSEMTRYKWDCNRRYNYCQCQPPQTLKFNGPYWVHTYYRPHRGLFKRSSWRCIWIPYYVAEIPQNIQVLGLPQPYQLLSK